MSIERSFEDILSEHQKLGDEIRHRMMTSHAATEAHKGQKLNWIRYVKALREIGGLSLKDAKELVEGMLRGDDICSHPCLSATIDLRAKRSLDSGRWRGLLIHLGLPEDNDLEDVIQHLEK